MSEDIREFGGREFTGYEEMVEAPQKKKPAGPSLLDEFRAEVNKPAEQKPHITIPVSTRKNLLVTYDPNFEFGMFQAWQNRATNRKTKDVDLLRFCRMVLANQNVGINFKGRDLHDDNGEPLSFRSRAYWELVGAEDTQDAVTKTFGNDAALIAHGTHVIEQSGYGDEEMDPTLSN